MKAARKTESSSAHKRVKVPSSRTTSGRIRKRAKGVSEITIAEDGTSNQTCSRMGRQRRKRVARNANEEFVMYEGATGASTTDGTAKVPERVGGSLHRKIKKRQTRSKCTPKVKDLSVSLGLEKPQKRLTQAQKNRLNDEELEEDRYNEEIYKLSNLEEVIRLSSVQDIVSDNESKINGDDSSVDLSDDDDDVYQNGNKARCPRPLPKRCRRASKVPRRSIRDEEVVSSEEMKEMSLIIKTTVSNKSLTSTAANLMADDLDCLNSKMEDYDKADEVVVVSIQGNNTKPNCILYGELGRDPGRQDQWLNKTASSAQDETTKDLMLRLFTYHSRKDNFPKQLYIEHLSWVTIVGTSSGNVGISRNEVLPWLPSFRENFSHKYPQLQELCSPGSGTDLDVLLKMCTLRVNHHLNVLLRLLLKTGVAIDNLVKHVTKGYYEKRAIFGDFEDLHDQLCMLSARFDESNPGGLKPIRLALEPPYFKTKDGLMAYPMTPDAVSRFKNFKSCFSKRDKQKWTTKDLQQLKLCIRETLISKRLNTLSDRYEVLMADCLRQYEKSMLSEGRFDAAPLEPFKRRCGKSKKCELEYSAKYGISYPVIAVLPGGITVRSEVTPRLLAEWRLNEENKLKCKTYEELVFMEREKVDWATVANKMVVKSRKHRTAEDCKLAWKHEVHPIVNNKRWGVGESRRLKDAYNRLGNDWFAVADELNASTVEAQRSGRTPYQCFFRIRNILEPPKKLVWTKELDEHVLTKFKDYRGNWRLVAASIENTAATKRQVIARYKKTINPVLRNGAFTRVEDCLLILTIEKLKPFLASEGHFGCLLSYLPWRCETTWKDRANNLFSDWIVPWTLEEDKKLLQLAVTLNRNWQKISEEFTSFKNRKGCLTRYKILKHRLKDERFNNSLEEYHEAYSMTRYNVFQYKHLKEILELLTRVKQNPLPEKHSHFPGLLRDRKPSEVRLQHMLLTFDKDVLDSAIKSLTRYVQTRDDYWRNWISKHGKRKRTFDRRTFHPENPQSVASAIHIRGLELKPREEIPNLSDFEKEIYKFYARFRRTKPLKPDADRPYIPAAKTLAQWPVICRVIQTEVDQLDDIPLLKEEKWKTLETDGSIIRSSDNKRQRNRTKTILRKSKSRVSIVEKAKHTGTKKTNTKAQIAQKRSRTRSILKNVSKNEEGYILIPSEPNIRENMNGRLRKKKEEEDPDFVAAVAVRNDKAFTGMANPRRSSRNSGALRPTVV